MTESPKLLPCPFCGETPSDDGWLRHDVDCYMDLGAKRNSDTRAEAWNRRAPDPERDAMAKVCEAARARMETYDKGEDYTGGIKSVEWNNLRAALADLERARKGEG